MDSKIYDFSDYTMLFWRPVDNWSMSGFLLHCAYLQFYQRGCHIGDIF